MKKPPIFLIILFINFFGFSQEIDTDKLYLQALQEYREGNYKTSLGLTTTALEVAPDYHDIRVLQVRNHYALQAFDEAHVDLEYLLRKAPAYEGVKMLSIQRLHQMKIAAALPFLERLLGIYDGDTDLMIHKAQLLLRSNRPEEARITATEIYQSVSLSDGQRYALHQIMNLTVENAVQVTGQYISFSNDYPRNDPWYILSAEYQHNFPRMALIGRATYSDRSYNSGSLYEIEAYPVFSEKFYAFGNIGFSDGTIFPDLRVSASGFYNFAPSFEAEAGFRSLIYNGNNHLTGIAGLTTYTGKFYLNIRAFIGPERLEKLVQNYQFNIRYYLSTPENYLFGRIGSGISPDEPTIYTRAQENPYLEAIFFSVGLNKTLGMHHVISISGGLLQEDLSNEMKGQQYITGIGYRYKF